MLSTRVRSLNKLRDSSWGILPFVIILLLWWSLSNYGGIPAYKLPTLSALWDDLIDRVFDGSLFFHVWQSAKRLVVAFLIGNGLALLIGFAIALDRHVSEFFRPLLTFLQSIAGIAWVPLAIIWLGIGAGPVIFVMVNTIFFSSVYNIVTGVEAIPQTLRRAVRCHGASGAQVYTQLIIPGAFVQILLGFRISMAYGFRAMVGAELIAGTDGLGFMIIEAANDFATDTVILGMLVIAVLWLLLDRFVFTPIERRTVVRWGMLKT